MEVNYTPEQSAVLRAAKFIERNPDRYDYYCVNAPIDTNDTSCLLMWIGYFYRQGYQLSSMNEPELPTPPEVARRVLGFADGGMATPHRRKADVRFYEHLHSLARWYDQFLYPLSNKITNAGYAAVLLRRFVWKQRVPSRIKGGTESGMP